MKPGQEIYVRLPTEAEERVLHTSLCLEWDEEKAVVSINDDELGLEPGQDLLIYFNEKTKFLQMAVRIIHAAMKVSRFCSNSSAKAIPSRPMGARPFGSRR